MKNDANITNEENTINTFICNTPGENSYATCRLGLKPGEIVSINGTSILSRLIKFSDNGYVYSIALTEESANLIYKYRIEVEAEGPHGFGSGSGYLLFTDKAGDSYSLRIFDSSRKVHYVEYNSDHPEIVKIQWSNNPF